jgi:hypothetical protein
LHQLKEGIQQYQKTPKGSEMIKYLIFGFFDHLTMVLMMMEDMFC